MIQRSVYCVIGLMNREVTERINKLSLMLKSGEQKLERMNKKIKKLESLEVQEPQEPQEPQEKEAENPAPVAVKVTKVPSCIEILKDEEREEALDGDPVAKEGKVTLILRSTSDDTKREAIRILRVMVLLKVDD